MKFRLLAAVAVAAFAAPLAAKPVEYRVLTQSRDIGHFRIDREGSDVDLLVAMPAGTSLLHIVGLQLDIADLLGVKVDLCTERELHPVLRDRILAEARAL